MAFDQGSGSGEINDINITPFVDVVLVLLVIFMVTAPMMMKDLLEIKLPKASQTDKQAVTTLAVVVTAQGQILLNGQLVTEDVLAERAKAASKDDPNTQVVIAADQESKHGQVVRVIDIVKSSGLLQFALQVEKPSSR